MKLSRASLALLCAAVASSFVPAACSNNIGSPAVPAQADRTRAVQSLAASTGPVFRVYTAGTTPGFLATASAWDIAPANGTTMWFTDGGTPAIGTITSSGTVMEYTAGLPAGSRPYSIVRDTKGDGWFTDQGSASIGKITSSGTIQEFTTAQIAGTYPQDVTIAPDGTPWFVTVGRTSYIVHATLDGKLTVYPVPSKLAPDGSLISDTAGNLWFMSIAPNFYGILVERKTGGKFVWHETGLEQAFEPCCPNLAPKRMVFGSDGNLWMTTMNYAPPKGNGANLLATLTSTGVKLVTIPSRHINGITSGLTRLGKDLWMTGDDPFQFSGGLWDMNSSKQFTGYPLSFNPVAIASGTGGDLWITSHFGSQASSIVQVTSP